MDAIGCLLHDGADGFPEVLDLPPHGLQTGQVAVQVNHGHLRTWMHLGIT